MAVKIYLMTESPRKNVQDVEIELGAAYMQSGHSSNRATAPGNLYSKFQQNQIRNSGAPAAIKYIFNLLEPRSENAELSRKCFIQIIVAHTLKALSSVWKLAKPKFLGYKAIM